MYYDGPMKWTNENGDQLIHRYWVMGDVASFLAQSNLTDKTRLFCVRDGRYVSEYPTFRKAWKAFYSACKRECRKARKLPLDD